MFITKNRKIEGACKLADDCDKTEERGYQKGENSSHDKIDRVEIIDGVLTDETRPRRMRFLAEIKSNPCTISSSYD